MERVTPIEYVLLGNFIKYDELQRLTMEAFAGSNANTLNVFIDLTNILNGAYQNGVRIENYSIVTSTIINLCSHVRAYYRTRHRVETNIFLFYSTNDAFANRKFIADYNNSHTQRINSKPQIHDMIISNIKLLNILVPYLPDIYIRCGTFEPGVMMFDTFSDLLEQNMNHPTVVLSKDLYLYQLPPVGIDTVMFRKSRSGSYVVTPSNCINRFVYDSRKRMVSSFLNGGLLSLLMTMSNMPSRNVYSLMDFDMAIKLLETAVKCGSITNSYQTDIEYVYTVLNDIRTMPIDITNFTSRFRALDIPYMHKIYKNSPESKAQYIMNLIDDNTVRDINNKYFKTNPLDLNRL